MSGKPQYNEAMVINAAITVFWQHGYAAASINDLSIATGLSRSSIYQRFGNKDGLFQEALATYTQRVLQRMKPEPENSAKERLEMLLKTFSPQKSAKSSTSPVGCFLCRSCNEKADLSEKGYRLALQGVNQQKEVINNILLEGVRSGELGKNANIDVLSWYYLGVLQSIVNFSSLGATSAILEDIIDLALSKWTVG